MTCSNCGEYSGRQISIVASVTRATNKKIIIELTEPQDRPIKPNKPVPFNFPFYLRERNEELEFCNINCMKQFINDQTERLNEKAERQQ